MSLPRFISVTGRNARNRRESLSANRMRDRPREARGELLWENKIYRATPALSSADGPIFRMRQWYQQFLLCESTAEIVSG